MTALTGIGTIPAYRSTIILILTPLLLLPLPLAVSSEYTQQGKCAYVLLLMAIYWTTEVIPLPVTSFLPIVLMPTLGILNSKVICQEYLKDTNMMFIGGLIMAVAIEKWNLHKRIALKVLLFVGAEPRWIMLGCMVPTWFLSMWISNTAATAMMVPIVSAVLSQIQSKQDTIRRESIASLSNGGYQRGAIADGLNQNESSIELSTNAEDCYRSDRQQQIKFDVDPEDDQPTGVDGDTEMFDDVDPSEVALKKAEERQNANVAKALNLCICYSATVGGIATLTGTTPNLIMKDNVDKVFAKYGKPSPISFGSWMIFALPVSVICLFLSWIWLQFFFLGFKKCFKVDKERNEIVRKIIQKEYDKLGAINFAEIMLIIHFVTLALLWLTRSPGFFDGWAHLFPRTETGWFVTDATASMFVAIMLFIVPSQRPNFLCLRSTTDFSKPGPKEALLNWPHLTTHMPWSVVILLGGGFALAKASTETGLSKLVSNWLVQLVESLPDIVMVMLLTALVAAFTEVTSNTATATLLMPVLADIAKQLGRNPLFYMIPAVLACSFAFMLPVATPPNAVVFSYGHIKVADMMKAGIGMNLICVLVVTFAVSTWGAGLFAFNELPWDSLTLNTTLAAEGLNFTTVSSI